MNKNQTEGGFFSHLTELRKRLIHSLIFLSILFVICYYFFKEGFNNVIVFNRTKKLIKKHLKELIKAKTKGYKSCILYIIQREDCKSFKIAKDIDEKYKNAFDEALKKGVKILCYDCKLSNEEIKLNKEIYYES